MKALEVALRNHDRIEFGIVIDRLYEQSQTQKERARIVNQIDLLVDKYPFFNWYDSLLETEPEPRWILPALPTRHRLKLVAGLYQKLDEFFRYSHSHKKISAKQVETLMDELINRLLQDFLQAEQQA
ncbi:hypothetical protein B7486_47870 [cyanobacterium TDX16]|nr:hypothetical protein B7486_47870 [cyanobacterium TDX16]